MAHEVEILPTALRELNGLPHEPRQRILRRIRGLATQPCPPGMRKRTGVPDGLRIRVGDYRVLYRVDDAERRVVIERVGYQRDIYR